MVHACAPERKLTRGGRGGRKINESRRIGEGVQEPVGAGGDCVDEKMVLRIKGKTEKAQGYRRCGRTPLPNVQLTEGGSKIFT